MSTRNNKQFKVGFLSLGCSKNLVDLQIMADHLLKAGYDVGVEHSKADIILVNTCAFIEAARQEAVDAIENACQYKADGSCSAVIVTGCLAQRYTKNIFKVCPSVDAVVGVDQLDELPQIIADIMAKKTSAFCSIKSGLPTRLFEPLEDGFVFTGGPYAYLKLGEGCMHACAFCAIPGIRGKLRSRKPAAIIEEARQLIKRGYKELNIVAQDISSYGEDFKDGTTLAGLLKELDKLQGDFRMRLLYGHPAKITDDLLQTIATSKHICHYLDVPIQHSHPEVLRGMHRADTVKHVPELVKRIRAAMPDATVRTTCLVGFPGETDEHFNHLVEFIKDVKYDHLGAFAFSPEEGTAAYDMGDEPDELVAEDRREALMKQQEKISRKLLKQRLGKVERVLLESYDEENDIWVGRTDGQAPDDIDGVTFVVNVPEKKKVGDFVDAVVVDSKAHDLIAEYRKSK